MFYIIGAMLTISAFSTIDPENGEQFQMAMLVEAPFFSFPGFFTMFTYWKCPKYAETKDTFFFHYEFKIYIVIYVVMSGFLFFLTRIMDNLGFQLAANTVVIFGYVSLLSLPSLLSVLWLPRKILNVDSWRNALCKDLVMMQKETELEIKEDLKDSMRRKELFEPFIHWMYREFSQETVLSFIEFVQFKQRLQGIIRMRARKNGNENEQDTQCVMLSLQQNGLCHEDAEQDGGGNGDGDGDDQDHYVLYDEVPRSEIVYSDQQSTPSPPTQENQIEIVVPSKSPGDDNSYDLEAADPEMVGMRNAAHLLYAKYIRVGAELEGNISGTLRERYRRKDELDWNLNAEELLHEFDDFIDSMFVFMKESYIRYSQHRQ